MASNFALSAISEFLTYAPKIAAFEAGQPVTISIPAASTTVDFPEVGKISVSESGTSITIQKAA